MHRTDQGHHQHSSTDPAPSNTTATGAVAPPVVIELDDDDEHHPFVCSLASIYSSDIHSLPMMGLSQQQHNHGDDDGEYTTTAEDASTLVLEPLGMSISFSQLVVEPDEEERIARTGGATANSAVGWDMDEDDAVPSDWRFAQTHPRSAAYHHRTSPTLQQQQHHPDTPPPVVSFWMLWRGPLLVYFVAMGLPTLSAYLLEHDRWNRMSTTVRDAMGPALVWASHPAAPRLYWQEHVHPYYIVPVLEYLCQWEHGHSYTSIAYWMHRMKWCPIPPPAEEEVLIYYRSIVVPHVMDDWKQDLAIAVALGTALTALRLLLLLLASSAATVPRTTTSTKHHDDEQENKEEDELEEKQPSSSSSSDSILPFPEDSLPGAALFRSAYSACGAFLAWRYFRAADFWPHFVAGTGDLSHCWDRIAVDADDAVYHHETALLKYYVLAQASYCVHSVTLGWVARRGSSSAQLLVSLMQSVLALCLSFLAYSLASVRRLVAVGMFALNVSQALRYVWQMLLAPTDGSGYLWWCRRTASSLLYWGTVLPSFVATHFYVFPLLWHSATTADEWRLDLEQQLWKGAADQFLRLGHACLVFLLLDAALSLQNLVEPVQALRSGEGRSRSH